MTQVIGIAGSLRRGSYNAALLRTALEFVPEDARLGIESFRDIPLYNYDVEVEGIPAPVARLKDKVAAADGLLILTPEYNNSIPGVAKNAIDWLTRPPADIPGIFHGKPVAVMSASIGPLRHRAVPERLAVRVAPAAHAAVVRRPSAGFPRGRNVRR